MRMNTLLGGLLSLAFLTGTAGAAVAFDPTTTQPIGYASALVFSKGYLTDGKTRMFRPSFDDVTWWGDIESFDVAPNGDILDKNGTIVTPTTTGYTPNWSAATQLDNRDFKTRTIITNTSNTTAVTFGNLTDLSNTQQAALNNSQTLLDYLRGDRSKEDGTTYRKRTHILGDIIQSSLLYVPYNSDPNNLSGNLLFVGANDGMLHAFDADTGEEKFAYIPGTIVPNLYKLAVPGYADAHQYYVNGELAWADVTFSDGSSHRILVGGLGAGGKGFFALDITSNDFTDPTKKFLWEVTDQSIGMANLGFSYSRPLIVRMKINGVARWVVIVGNGYDGDGVTARPASLFVLDIETGELIREIQAGTSSKLPYGLSSPSAADLDADGNVDLVYAGDLEGNLWRFEVGDSDPANWHVSFGNKPLATLKYTHPTTGATTTQPISAPPRIASYPDGGLLILVGTGRMLTPSDATNTDVQSVYGLRDRLDGTRIASLSTDSTTGNILVQYQAEHTYSRPNGTIDVVRASTAYPLLARHDGWLVDLPGGERVLAPMVARSGRLLFTTINPTNAIDINKGGEIWSNEINLLTGGAPYTIVYDMNEDKVLTTDDNVDGNGDGDTLDPEDRVTALRMGYGIVASTPTTVALTSTTGTYFVNRQFHSQKVEMPTTTPTDPGLLGGHFDVDTTSYISPINSGSTDGHVHQYDDKFNVKGVDYFNLLDTKLHNIDRDITNAQQKFKLIIVNADKSPGGRLVINQAYDENVPGTYTPVTRYDNASSAIYSLGGAAGSMPLTQLGIYFDVNAILNRELIPTQTDCVRSNTLSSDGRWRNAALTIWAVKVNADGTDAFTLKKDVAGHIVGITNGLLWESTLFWHWKGPCAHQYTSLDATYTDNSGNTVTNPATGKPYTVFEYWRDHTILREKEKKKKKKKRKHSNHDKGEKHDKDDEEKEDHHENETDNTCPTPPCSKTCPSCKRTQPGRLKDPARASWNELQGL